MSINTPTGRKYDYFKNLIIPVGCYFMVRLDGNCFSSYTDQMERPFDQRFYQAVKESVVEMMEYIPSIYKAHFHSDEISLYFDRDSDWFNRRLEKVTSITAGLISSKFSVRAVNHGWGEAHFDSRVLVTPNKVDVEEYEKDRMLNAFRGCVNSYSYYKLRDSGLGARQATKRLATLKSKERQEMLFQEFGININDAPKWQKTGMFLVRESYEKEGFDPIKKQAVVATRNRIVEIKD